MPCPQFASRQKNPGPFRPAETAVREAEAVSLRGLDENSFFESATSSISAPRASQADRTAADRADPRRRCNDEIGLVAFLRARRDRSPGRIATDSNTRTSGSSGMDAEAASNISSVCRLKTLGMLQISTGPSGYRAYGPPEAFGRTGDACWNPYAERPWSRPHNSIMTAGRLGTYTEFGSGTFPDLTGEGVLSCL